MTRQDLRVFLGEWFCGCGSPDGAARALRDLLQLHPLSDHQVDFRRLVPDEGLQYLVLYTLDHFRLTEHGGAVTGGWLTDRGRDVLAALDREAGDNFMALSESSCMHGYSIETELPACPECGALNQKGRAS